jgi:hypothetical protein
VTKHRRPVDGHELTTVQGIIDQSEDRAHDLAGRYRHIRNHMNVNQAMSRLSGIANDGFQGILAQLIDCGVFIGADAVLPRKLARRHERFGLTIVIPGSAPLIWLNLLKHDSTCALVDTVVHEAIHSTGRILGRHVQTPQPDEAIASYGEEIVALVGANLILGKIAFSARRQVAQNILALTNCNIALRRLGCSERFLSERFAEAELAAAFLTDVGIEIACPTLETVQSLVGSGSDAKVANSK